MSWIPWLQKGHVGIAKQAKREKYNWAAYLKDHVHLGTHLNDFSGVETKPVSYTHLTLPTIYSV